MPTDPSRLARGWRRLQRLRRTSAFRLTLFLGVAFAAGVALILGLVYLQTARYLTRRVDDALAREAAVFARTDPRLFQARLRQESARDPLNGFGLFDASGRRRAGDTPLTPGELGGDGVAQDLARHGAPARALKARLPSGETLVVERDTRQLVELRRIVLSALVWSGAAIGGLGLLCAVALSLQPLRRVQAFQEAMEAIAAGAVDRRLPAGSGGDELDQLARMVNAALDELERLVVQARTVGEGVAHELRTPLTRLRATLDHAADAFDGADDPRRPLLQRCVAETDAVLGRFQALLRIAAVEARSRRAGFATASLSAVVEQVAELYQPLAEERGLAFHATAEPDVAVRGDPDLLMEAVLNLVDNAVKFTPPGGLVTLGLRLGPEGPLVEVRDTGPGVAPEERRLVTQRFYRAPHASGVAGHGLGLSLVGAVAALHGFELRIGDGAPGALVSLVCRSAPALRG